jgi:hypothetical protein
MRFGVWLLDCFDVDEALVGDLLERRQTSRSTLWFAREAVVAVLRAVVRQLRGGVRAAACVAVGTATFAYLWVRCTLIAYLWVSEQWMNAWTTGGDTWVAGVHLNNVVSRTLFVWWQLYGGGLCVIWCVASAIAGLVAAGASRGRSASLVLVAVVAQLPMTMWIGAPILLRGMHNQVFWLNFDVVGACVLVGMPLTTLIAGFRAIAPRRPTCA